MPSSGWLWSISLWPQRLLNITLWATLCRLEIRFSGGSAFDKWNSAIQWHLSYIWPSWPLLKTWKLGIWHPSYPSSASWNSDIWASIFLLPGQVLPAPFFHQLPGRWSLDLQQMPSCLYLEHNLMCFLPDGQCISDILFWGMRQQWLPFIPRKAVLQMMRMSFWFFSSF